MRPYYENPNIEHITLDEILTLYATKFSLDSGHLDPEHSETLRRLLGVYAQEQERKAMTHMYHPGRANLECALHMAEVYMQVGFVNEAHDSYPELLEAAEHEQVFGLFHRIEALRRI